MERADEVANLGRGGRLEGVQPLLATVEHSGGQPPV
jgi:hypothetical protein